MSPLKTKPKIRSAQDKLQVKADMDPVESAKVAGLRYITDSLPDIRRKHTGKGFTCLGGERKPLRDLEELCCIKRYSTP